MVTILDVATSIVEKSPNLTAMQLQKLTYYVQAWHATIFGKPAFDSDFQAWKLGPAAPELHDHYRGQWWVGRTTHGDSSNLSDDLQLIVDLVLKEYGGHNGDQLSDLTHKEMPWLESRGDLRPDESSNTVITLDSMIRCYSTQTLAGNSPIEIALVGPNPAERETEDVLRLLDEALTTFNAKDRALASAGEFQAPSLRTGFELRTYVQESPTASSAR